MEYIENQIKNSSVVSDEIKLFWEAQALENITWTSKWSTVIDGDFNNLPVNWFINAKLNACYNCLDRHLTLNSEKVAIIWEGNNPDTSLSLTYLELHTKVCKFANALKSLNVTKGDRVCIYLPMIPEAIIAMLACARIGAIHSVVFAGFSSTALKDRILDADAKLLITADANMRGDKFIPLKQNVDLAVKDCPNVQNVVVIRNANNHITWNDKDICYDKIMQAADNVCDIEPMLATDPLFILYTSGSTGKPKGVLHSTGGYLVYVATSFKKVFQYEPQDIFWCSADIGWITGHSYLVYGPLLNCATTLLYDGVPSHPTFSRYWEIIDKYKVTQFYTSPTAIRALRKEGDEYLASTSRSSLKILGVVGEPLNPDVWEWFYKNVGNSRCAIVNTWWQTETGGIIISPTSKNIVENNPGTVGLPMFGIKVDIIDDNSDSITIDNKVGRLIIKEPWPGLMQTIYNNNKRYKDTYFKEISGCFATGDGAYKIGNNFFVIGRNDDVIKVSGHRIGTEELESAIVTHENVAESAVVGVADLIKGEAIYAFVVLKTNAKYESSHLKNEITQYVRDIVGAFAKPDYVQFVSDLPKTRSGKIMRRILRKIANNDINDLGDTSTLADSSVIDKIIMGRK